MLSEQDFRAARQVPEQERMNRLNNSESIQSLVASIYRDLGARVDLVADENARWREAKRIARKRLGLV